MTDPSDFLVVGAGSAGCVVTRVLAQAGYRVRLIEPTNIAAPRRRPADYLHTFGTPEDWGLRTAPQPELANRQIDWPRGRGPGGSSRINAMIWYPPRERDLHALHTHGGDAWAPDRLRQSLAAVARWVRPQSPPWLSQPARCFLRSAHEAVEPPAAFERMGDRHGRRTAADVLAESSAPDHAVQWVAAVVDRVLFHHDRAIGIETSADGDRGPQRWFASRGIILCGGSIGSPAILTRSGIGPAEVLRQAGIPMRLEAADVGRHLADHLIMPVVFSLRGRTRFPTQFSPGDLARWHIAGTGPISSNLAEAGAIYRLPASPGDSEEVQVHVTPTHYLLHPGPQSPAAMTIGVNLCRPSSRGEVTILSADPQIPPRIDPRYLSDPGDLERLADAVEIARSLAAESALRHEVEQEKVPGAGRRSRTATIKAIRRFAQTLYHPTGTCRLGSDRHSVVDPRCQVRGCDGLYVIDASVLPEIPSINPNATVMMLAHHAATALKKGQEPFPGSREKGS